MEFRNILLDQYPMVLVPGMKNLTTFTNKKLFAIAV